MTSRVPKSPQSTDKTEKKGKKSSPGKSGERHPEQSELYDIRVWGTCKDGEQKLGKYREKPHMPGRYCQVFMAQKDGRDYALKKTEKLKTETGKTRAVFATREVQALRQLRGTPFINIIYDAFHTRSHMVIVLDFADGGDLYGIMRQKSERRKSFPESEITFYLAEIVLALEAVHKNNIVHRDIKGDNILVSKDGHIQLADFGLCKYLDEDAGTEQGNSPVGTKEYMAPELIVEEWRKDKCGFAQDWYSVGVLGLQMFAGFRYVPYGGPVSQSERYSVSPWDLPENWSALLPKFIRAMRIGKPDIPARSCSGRRISDELTDLLTRLLKTRCSERLGHSGTDEIKQHDFFVDVNWEDAANKKLTPPQRGQ